MPNFISSPENDPPELPRVVFDDLTAEQQQELQGLDQSARGAAAAAVELTAQETAQAEGIYQQADQRRAELERIIYSATAAPLPGALRMLWENEVEETRQLAAVLGATRAKVLRQAERASYFELWGQRYGNQRSLSATKLIARRRLAVQDSR